VPLGEGLEFNPPQRSPSVGLRPQAGVDGRVQELAIRLIRGRFDPSVGGRDNRGRITLRDVTARRACPAFEDWLQFATRPFGGKRVALRRHPWLPSPSMAVREQRLRHWVFPRCIKDSLMSGSL
jgi:hypothetical protein